MSSMTSLIPQIISATEAATNRTLALVLDDISITPSITQGFPAKREAPMMFKVIIGSLKNKILIILPILLILTAIAPQAITPLLGVGGLFLSYEGSKALINKLSKYDPEAKYKSSEELSGDEAAREKERVSDVIKAEFVLSAEIMSVGLSVLPHGQLFITAISLIVTAVVLTLVVYGSGLLIIKSDDFGKYMAEHGHFALTRSIGRFVLWIVPKLLKVISWIGGFALLWVSGQLMLEALAYLGIDHIHNLIENIGDRVAANSEFWGETTKGALDALFSLGVGTIMSLIVTVIVLPIWHKLRGEAS